MTMRPPSPQDGREVWQLVKQSPVLDLNSTYHYILMCDYFRDSCVLAHHGTQLIGALIAFKHPRQRETLFVWQIVVDPVARGRGLAGRMIDLAIQQTGCTWLETTVSPSNHASRHLFESWAQHHSAKLTDAEGYPAAWFKSTHEHEPLLRIGPIATQAKKQQGAEK